MKKTLNIVYVYPSFGGIFDYGRRIEKIYRAWPEVKISSIILNQEDSIQEILSLIEDQKTNVIHFEMGGADWQMYKLSKLLLKTKPHIQQVVTIHDTGIILARPSGWNLPPGKSFKLIPLKIARLAIERVIRLTSLKNWIRNPRITLITLRKDSLPNALYLPLVLFEEKVPISKRKLNKKIEIGFVGYWSANKGIETLIDAYDEIRENVAEKLRLKIYGGPAGEEDDYSRTIHSRVDGREDIELGGDIADGRIPQVIANLNIIVLPYWPDNPAGSSGIAIHAALSGTPVVASRAPQLLEILNGNANYYEPANDVNALAVILSRVVEDYDRALNKARNLQEKILSERSLDVISRRLRELYEEAGIL